MTEITHTKGEWRVRSGDRETVVCGDKVIATVPWPNAKANASLIASAPDMYDALEELYAAVEVGKERIGAGRQEMIKQILLKVEGAVDENRNKKWRN